LAIAGWRPRQAGLAAVIDGWKPCPPSRRSAWKIAATEI